MAEELGEKTEAPTPRRLSEAREEGRVARSTDLTAAIMLLGGVIMLAAFGSRMIGAMRMLLERVLGAAPAEPTESQITAAVNIAGRAMVEILGPLAIGLMILGVLTGVVQVGVLVAPKVLAPRWSKLSPIKGIQQIFSMRGLMRLAMSMAKVAVVLTVATIALMYDLPKVLDLIGLDAQSVGGAMAWIGWSVALKIALVLVLLGLMDYVFNRWRHERDLMMSKYEVKQELKNREGDPLIKQRRARVARQLLLQRIGHDVPKADVVVSNPTHFAVALKYDALMSAPKVVAKGADLVAVRIRQVAASHGVPIVERPPLARALYRSVEVGQEIPPKFYTAVAEILAYVYRLSGRKTA